MHSGREGGEQHTCFSSSESLSSSASDPALSSLSSSSASSSCEESAVKLGFVDHEYSECNNMRIQVKAYIQVIIILTSLGSILVSDIYNQSIIRSLTTKRTNNSSDNNNSGERIPVTKEEMCLY